MPESHYICPLSSGDIQGAPILIGGNKLCYLVNDPENTNGRGALVCIDYTSNTQLWCYPQNSSQPGYGNKGCPAAAVKVNMNNTDYILAYFNTSDSSPVYTNAVLLNPDDGSVVENVYIEDQFEEVATYTKFNFGYAVIFHSQINIYAWMPLGFSDNVSDAPDTQLLTIPTDFSKGRVIITSLIALPTWVAYLYTLDGRQHFARTNLELKKGVIKHEDDGRLDEKLDKALSGTGLAFFPNGYRIYVSLASDSADVSNQVATYPCSHVYKKAKNYPMPTLTLPNQPYGSVVGRFVSGSAPDDESVLCCALQIDRIYTATFKGSSNPTANLKATATYTVVQQPFYVPETNYILIAVEQSTSGGYSELQYVDLSESTGATPGMPLTNYTFVAPPVADGEYVILALQSKTDSTTSIMVFSQSMLIGD